MAAATESTRWPLLAITSVALGALVAAGSFALLCQACRASSKRTTRLSLSKSPRSLRGPRSLGTAKKPIKKPEVEEFSSVLVESSSVINIDAQPRARLELLLAIEQNADGKLTDDELFEQLRRPGVNRDGTGETLRAMPGCARCSSELTEEWRKADLIATPRLPLPQRAASTPAFGAIGEPASSSKASNERARSCCAAIQSLHVMRSLSFEERASLHGAELAVAVEAEESGARVLPSGTSGQWAEVGANRRPVAARASNVRSPSREVSPSLADEVVPSTEPPLPGTPERQWAELVQIQQLAASARARGRYSDGKSSNAHAKLSRIRYEKYHAQQQQIIRDSLIRARQCQVSGEIDACTHGELDQPLGASSAWQHQVAQLHEVHADIMRDPGKVESCVCM